MLQAIVGLPPAFYFADDSSPVGLAGLIPGGFGVSEQFICPLADGIEQMANLLPTK